MPTPREQRGALSEASRLLQEGLQLLDDRTREVDALVQDAQEQAREITYDAEKRAQELTAEAERHRSELEEQVAALRAEVAEVRAELAQLRAAQPQKGGRGRAAAVVAAVAPVVGTSAQTSRPPTVAEAGVIPAAAETGVPSPETETEAEPFGPTLLDPVAAADAAEAAEPAGTPRWGRPSSIAAAQQAIRARSSRPRWLPRWLPFVIVLLAGAGVVMASVNVQSSGRGSSGDQPSPGVILVTLAPTTANTSTGASELSIAAATSIATSLAAVGAAGSAGQSTQPATPGRTPTGAAPTRAVSATPTPRLNVRTLGGVDSTRSPVTFVQPTAPLVTPSASLPYDVSPDGPIVAAYTTYATYNVRPGDTLNRVATDFGVASESIMRASGLANPNLLLPGQVLTIPRESGWLYRVQPGETLDNIALRFGTSTTDLIAASTLSSPIVRPGDLLFIPNHTLPDTKQ